MKIKICVLTIFCVISTYAQQIKVEYLFIKSPIAKVKEHLYHNGKQTILIQDSITQFLNNTNDGYDNRTTFASKITSKNSQGQFREFLLTDTANQQEFTINDVVKKLEWTISPKKTKKILNYLCLEAKTEFRGRKYTVYFTKDLPYNIGPYKFFGLDGLILEISADNLSYYIWKAQSIDLDNKDNISYKLSDRNINTISLKEFVEKKDAERTKFMSEIEIPDFLKGDTTTIISNRNTIETLYEWEK